MHLLDFIFGSFEHEDQCMNVKFVTLRVIWTLRGQIYVLDALSPTKIDWIFLDMEGLDELLIRIGELGHSFPQSFLILSNLLSLKRTQQVGLVYGLEDHGTQ